MSKAVSVPKHLWIVGILALLWNLMGAVDYVMTQTRNEAYMAQFDQAQLDYFYGVPVWFVFFWALAVWGSVLGSVLLLLRKRGAVGVFAVSFVSMLVTTVYSYGLSNGREVMGATGMVFSLVIFVVALGLVLYSQAMRGRGVLA